MRYIDVDVASASCYMDDQILVLPSKPPTMSSQLHTRYDRVRTNRLRYLSHFASSVPETKQWGPAFASYYKAAQHTSVAGVSRIRQEYVEDKFGRYHSNTDNYRGLGLQRMEKKVRNFLCDPCAQDIDIENSAPTVINQLYQQEGCDTSYLTFFVHNYESAMNDLRMNGFDGDKTKMVKNWMLFGIGKGADNLPFWVHQIKQELYKGRLAMYDKYPDLRALSRDRDEENSVAFEENQKKRSRDGKKKEFISNMLGLFVSSLYQRYEGKILLAMDQAGRDLNIWDDDVVWIHDGIMAFPKSPIQQASLKAIESYVEKELSLSIILKIKPVGECLDLDTTKFPSTIALNDITHYSAAKIVEMAVEGKYVRDRTAEYFLSQGIWMRSPADVQRNLCALTQDLNICKIVINPKTEEESIKPFSTMQPECKRIVSSLDCLLKNPTTDDFARNVVLGGIGKLAFKDGYYEFTSTEKGERYGQFIEGGYFDTFTRVNSVFPPRIQEDVDFVFAEIINPMFDNTEEGLKGVFLTALGRALAGCMDKRTYILHGPRNSGKSVLFQLLENALDGYVKTIPSGVFAVGSGGGGDSFRQNGYMMEAELARIIKLSEMPSSTATYTKVKMDGSKIKAFQSMKEGIVARPLYMMQRSYYSLGTGFFLMNDIPEFVPSDSMDRCHLFELPNEFLDPCEKEKDVFNATKKVSKPEIEAWIQDKKYTNAIIHILLDAYRPTPIVPLPSMIQCKESVMVGQGDEQYLACVEITMNQQDRVLFTDLKIALEKGGIKDNNVAMGRSLLRIVQDTFRRFEKESPDPALIRRQDRHRKSSTFSKQFYHYMRIRTIMDRVEMDKNYQTRDHGVDGVADGAFAENFFPGRGN